MPSTAMAVAADTIGSLRARSSAVRPCVPVLMLSHSLAAMCRPCRQPRRLDALPAVLALDLRRARHAPVAELVDAPDSKSGDGNIVLVRTRPGAPAFAAARLRLASQPFSFRFTRRCRERAFPPPIGGGWTRAIASGRVGTAFVLSTAPTRLALGYRLRASHPPRRRGGMPLRGQRETDSIVKQPAEKKPTLRRPIFEARGAPSVFAPGKSEGAERRKALSANVTPLRQACEARRGKACTHLAMRPPPGAPPRHLQTGAHVGPAISPRPRFLNRHSRQPMQRAPRSVPLVARERSPGAARVRGYEPRPQGPHLAPSSKRP